MKRRYGLEERDELAPVKTSISDWGNTSIERTDEWGEKATAWTEKTTFASQLKELLSDPKLLALALLFLPALPAFWLNKKISSRANGIISISGIFLTMVMLEFFKKEINDFGRLYFLFLYMYFVFSPLFWLGWEWVRHKIRNN